jgi:hypothetical protein
VCICPTAMSPSPSPQRSSVSSVRPAPHKKPALPQLSLPVVAAAPIHATISGAQTARFPSSHDAAMKPIAPLHQLFRPAAVPAKSSPRNQFYRINMLVTGGPQQHSVAHMGDASEVISISSTISCVSGNSPSRRHHHHHYQQTRELDEDRAAVYALSRHGGHHAASSRSPPTLALDQPPRVSTNVNNGNALKLKEGSFLPNINKSSSLNNTLQIPVPPAGMVARRSPREVQLTLPSIFSNGTTSGTPRNNDISDIATATTSSSDQIRQPPQSLSGTQNGSTSSFVNSDSEDEDDRPRRGSTRSHHHAAVSSVTSANSSIGERRLSRISEGQLHATKKATARVLKMMSSINISKSSRMIAVFKEFDANLVAKYLHKHCRTCRPLLTKEEFYVLVRSIVTDLKSAAFGGAGADSDDAVVATAASSRRGSRSSAETTNSTVSTAIFRQRSLSKGHSEDDKTTTQPGQQQPQLLRREDTDPIYALLDEEELGILDVKHVRSRFFTSALASPSDILARVIRMVFSSSAYYILESTISRFELQMMSDLLHEELLGGVSDGSEILVVPHEVLEKMHLRDREALIAHETAREEMRRVEKQNKVLQMTSTSSAAKHPRNSTATDIQDDDDDDDVICLRLRDAVYESEDARKTRLVKMLAAIREMPNLLNNASRGCVTVRHLRGMCSEQRFHIMGEVDIPPTQETGWSRRRETVVVQRLRYDDAYTTLATYLLLSPPAPTNLSSVSVPAAVHRAALLVTAAASFISKSFDVAKSSALGNSEKTRHYEEGDDPILAEAIEDYQMIQEGASRRQRSDSMVIPQKRPVSMSGDVGRQQSDLAGRQIHRKQQQLQNSLASSNGSPSGGASSNNLATPFDRPPMMNSMLSEQQTTPRRSKNDYLAAMASQADLYRRISASGNSSGSSVGQVKEALDLGLEHHRTDSFTASPSSPMLPAAVSGSSGELLSSVPNSPHIRVSAGSSTSLKPNGKSAAAIIPQPQRRLSNASHFNNSNNNTNIKRKGNKGASSTTSPSATLLIPGGDPSSQHNASPSISSRTTTSSQHIDEQQYKLDFPPEHGNPVYASREGIVFRHSDRCPEGRPVAHDLWV